MEEWVSINWCGKWGVEQVPPGRWVEKHGSRLSANVRSSGSGQGTGRKLDEGWLATAVGLLLRAAAG